MSVCLLATPGSLFPFDDWLCGEKGLNQFVQALDHDGWWSVFESLRARHSFQWVARAFPRREKAPFPERRRRRVPMCQMPPRVLPLRSGKRLAVSGTHEASIGSAMLLHELKKGSVPKKALKSRLTSGSRSWLRAAYQRNFGMLRIELRLGVALADPEPSPRSFRRWWHAVITLRR